MSRRDIDALARLLDGDPTLNGEATAETHALGGLARAMEATAARPRPEFKADLRAVLIEAARAQAEPPSLLTRWRLRAGDTTARWRYSTRLAAATGATAVALSGGGVALAADRALPGDPFYGVKLAWQDARVALASDAVERGGRRLAYADDRLGEAEAAAAVPDQGGAAWALVEADGAVREGAAEVIAAAQERQDPAVLDVAGDFARSERLRVRSLLPVLDGPAARAAEDLLVSLGRVVDRVDALQGDCAACLLPAAGAGFDFGFIPPADQPFQACPCAVLPADADPPEAAEPAPRRPGNRRDGDRAGKSNREGAQDRKRRKSDGGRGGAGAGPEGSAGGATGALPGAGSPGGTAPGGTGGGGDGSSGGGGSSSGGGTGPAQDAVGNAGGAVGGAGGGATGGGGNGSVSDPVEDIVDDVVDEVEEVLEDIVDPVQSELPGLPLRPQVSPPPAGRPGSPGQRRAARPRRPR